MSDVSAAAALGERLSTLEVASLDPELRRHLAQAWTEDALAEHASIASFARFSMHLLSVGAPASLLEATHRAALDEIEHTRFAFVLASRYAGAPLQPGPLRLHGDELAAADLPSIVRSAVLEGCIGETLAARQAEVAASGASPAPLRELLERIAADETRHAALAWQFVAWALRTAPVDAAGAAARAFTEALDATVLPSPAGRFDDALRDHGRLGEGQRAALALETRRDVLEPAVHALLGPAWRAAAGPA